MKLRRTPEDFQVDEVGDERLGEGRYALYRLTKRSRGTLEAVAAVARRLHLPRQKIGYGGLKDRHAVTRQYVSIADGPREGFAEPGLTLEYLGQTPAAFDSTRNLGNRFTLVVRRLRAPVAESAAEALEACAAQGAPNYFDDQRFGSLGSSGEYVARHWCVGDYEQALRLALVDPNPHDSAERLLEKQRIAAAWGDFESLRGQLADRTAKAAVEHLARRPGDFRGAIARIPQELRGLYLSAFQSALWNAMADAAIRRAVGEETIERLAVGDRRLAFYRELPPDTAAELRAASLPLPSARTELSPGPESELMRQVLAGHGLEPRQLRIKYPRDSFFARGWRDLIVTPRGASSERADDDLYPGYQRLTLRFELPKAAYATIVLKRLFLNHPQEHTSRTATRRRRQRKHGERRREA